MIPQAVNKLKSDAQKVTDFNIATGVFNFLGSRNLAAKVVEYV